MGIFDFLQHREQPDARANHAFDTEDRDLSLKIRKQRAELKERQLELENANMELKAELERMRIETQIETTKQQLAELKGYDDEEIVDDEGSSLDKMLMLLLTQIMSKNNTPVSAPNIPSQSLVTPPTQPEITTEQIQDFWGKIPKPQQKQLKKLKDTELSDVIQRYVPTLSDKDKDKVKAFVKAQK